MLFGCSLYIILSLTLQDEPVNIQYWSRHKNIPQAVPSKLNLSKANPKEWPTLKLIIVSGNTYQGVALACFSDSTVSTLLSKS